MLHNACEGLRLACRNHLSLSIMWVLRLELRTSVLGCPDIRSLLRHPGGTLTNIIITAR